MEADKTCTTCDDDSFLHEGKPIIAAFDFDGTLTYRDTLFSFLFFQFSPWKVIASLPLIVPSLIKYVLKKATRQQVKEHILELFFSGMSIKTLEDKGARFATSALNKKLRPEGLKRLHWHQNQGHRCILISASLDVYLTPWAKAHGFDDLLSSQLATERKGVVTGKLKGVNCWGAEKTRRLEELLGPKSAYVLYAYGNSRGDQELLELADFSYYCTFNEE